MTISSKFERHNEEVRKVWDAFKTKKPIRVPIVFGVNESFSLLDKELNIWNYSFQDYFNSPDIMMEVQLNLQKWIRLNVPQDQEMGIPRDGWGTIRVDFQNNIEAAWLGCPIKYVDDNVPETLPILKENKNKLYQMKIPDPVYGNIMGKVHEYYQYLKKKLMHYEFEGQPVKGVIPMGHMTDGPFTIAAELRGATELCLDIYEDPSFVHDLMNFVTEAIIIRGKAWWDIMDVKYPFQEWRAGFADDSIELLSKETYREFVLPYHRRIVNTFSKGGPNHIHLCGNAQHLFKTLQEEFNIQDFYVGFPTDLGRMRKELGKQVLFMGNIHPMILYKGPKETIEDEVKKLLDSGIMEGGNFIMSDGGGLAPGNSIENLQVMYDTGRRYGEY